MLAQFARVEEGILIDSKDAKRALILKQITKTTKSAEKTQKQKARHKKENTLLFNCWGQQGFFLYSL